MNDSCKIRVYYIASALLALIAALLRTLSLFIAFDTGIGYFRTHAALPIFLHSLEAVCLLFFCGIFLLIPKGRLRGEAHLSGTPLQCASGILALLFVVNLIRAIKTGGGDKLPVFLLILGIICLLCGAAYFICRLLFCKYNGFLVILLGCLMLLGLACLISFTYFDRYTPMNAPHKTGLHLALISAMFFFLYELRARTDTAMPRARIFSSALSLFLCVTVGVSDVIAFPAGIFTDVSYLFQDLLLIGFAVYIGITMITDTRFLFGTENRNPATAGKDAP